MTAVAADSRVPAPPQLLCAQFLLKTTRSRCFPGVHFRNEETEAETGDIVACLRLTAGQSLHWPMLTRNSALR